MMIVVKSKKDGHIITYYFAHIVAKAIEFLGLINNDAESPFYATVA